MFKTAGLQCSKQLVSCVQNSWSNIFKKLGEVKGLGEVKALGEVKGDCTVIYQLFDNSFHMAKTEEGGLIPAVREPGPGGKYHVHGEAVFAPKELQYSTFNLVKPLLEAAEPYQRILVSPLPRYLQGRCCDRFPTFRMRTTRRYRRRPFWPVDAT